MANFLAEHTPVPFERYRVAVAHEEMNSRRRNTMEDCHRILPTLGPDLETFSYFGIYDGHGGRQIVDFLEDAFEQNIIIELKEPDEASVLERLSRYLRRSVLVECSTYIVCDKLLLFFTLYIELF